LTQWKSPSYQLPMNYLQEGDAWNIVDSRNIIHKDFISVAVIVTKEWYAQELCYLWEAIHQKQIGMWMLIWMSLHPCLVGNDILWRCCATMPTTLSRHHPMWYFFCLYSWRKYYTAAISQMQRI
jgi:hypothetical protein